MLGCNSEGRKEGESEGVRKERGKEEQISCQFFARTHVLLGQSSPAGMDSLCGSQYWIIDKTIFPTMHKFTPLKL